MTDDQFEILLGRHYYELRRLQLVCGAWLARQAIDKASQK